MILELYDFHYLQTDHTMLVGTGANEYAQEMGIPEVHPDQLLTEEAKREYTQFLKFKRAVEVDFRPQGGNLGHDTVGAAAVDCRGNVACATSTGGITAKRPGRVGDSPLIGEKRSSVAFLESAFTALGTSTSAS